MKNTTNYKLKKPEGTDVVNVEDFNANADIIDGKLKELETNEIFYAVATGSANTYAVSISAISTLSTYFDGLAVCVKINAVSTGASTINVNGWGAKAIVDSLGNPISNGGLKANTPYTLRYNGVNFILQGKGGGGNVTADKILIGATATGDSGAVVGTMPDNGAISITPGMTAQTVPQGYTSGGTVAGDSNLITGNIKAGVSIFGVTGKSSVVDTSDGTATADKILTGSNAYINGSKVVGIMGNNGAVTITPGTSSKTIPQGYHNGSGIVPGEVNLVTGNIKSGVTIFGVAGKSSVVETSDGTATAGQVLSGSTAYVNGSKLTGSMPNYSGGTHVTGINNTAGVFSTSYGDGNNNAYIQPPVGYYDGSSWVKVAEPGLIASNIKSGVSIFGINGNATPSSLGGLSLVSSGTINGGSVSTNSTIILPSSYVGQAKYWYGSVTIQFTNGPGTWNFYGIYNSINSSAPYSCNYWRISGGWAFVPYSNPVIFLTSTVLATSYAITYYAYN